MKRVLLVLVAVVILAVAVVLRQGVGFSEIEQVIDGWKSDTPGTIMGDYSDVPDEILAQMGNRVQHALRAYTPSEQKVVKAAASAFRVNKDFDTETAISELGTGEALISFQDEKGAPEIVERATILPPQSYMGAINDMVRM